MENIMTNVQNRRLYLTKAVKINHIVVYLKFKKGVGIAIKSKETSSKLAI